jgi:hypothetical protein
MSVFGSLFPKANRLAAGVAFLRTAWQTAQATGALAVTGGVVVTANDLASVDWVSVGLTVAGVGVTAVIAGGVAAVNILVHGLPAAYTAASAGVAAPVDTPAPVEPVVETPAA